MKASSTRPRARVAVRQARKAPPATPPLLDVVGVSKSFRRGPETIVALKDVTLRLHPRETVAVVGRSGSGKTTLLNVIACWEEPDDGVVLWRESAPAVRDCPSWRQVAVLPQKFGLLES